MRFRAIALISCLGAASGCGSSTAPHTTPPAAGLVLSAGNQQTDTVGDVLPQPLEVQVNAPTNQQASGQVVQFISIEDSAAATYEAYVESPLGSAMRPFLAETLDASGRASAIVGMGGRTGSVRLIVKVPAFGYVDTARFTATPGNAVAIVTSPNDTAVVAGASVTLVAKAVDRGGNPRADAVRISVTSGPGTMAGNTLTTTAIGRVVLVASGAMLVDTAYVSSVPQGVLAASTGLGIATFNTDGSNYAVLHLGQIVGHMKWAPSGTSLAFDQDVTGCDGTSFTIQTTDLSGHVTVVDQRSTYDMYPSYSRDGTWIYFSPNAGYAGNLWRVHPDGTGDDSLGTMNPGFDLFPTVSPGGTQVAYSDIGSGQGDLRIMTVSTGAVTDLAINGWSPEWSPVSNEIAYISGYACAGPLAIANSDGTGVRLLTTADYQSSFDWSPDGQWLIAANAKTGKVDLINATTGATLPLGFTSGLISPSWMP